MIIIFRYCIAITLGHVEIELPYISDAGTHVPECSIFAQMLNIVAVLGMHVLNELFIYIINDSVVISWDNNLHKIQAN